MFEFIKILLGILTIILLVALFSSRGITVRINDKVYHYSITVGAK